MTQPETLMPAHEVVLSRIRHHLRVGVRIRREPETIRIIQMIIRELYLVLIQTIFPDDVLRAVIAGLETLEQQSDFTSDVQRDEGVIDLNRHTEVKEALKQRLSPPKTV